MGSRRLCCSFLSYSNNESRIRFTGKIVEQAQVLSLLFLLLLGADVDVDGQRTGNLCIDTA